MLDRSGHAPDDLPKTRLTCSNPNENVKDVLCLIQTASQGSPLAEVPHVHLGRGISQGFKVAAVAVQTYIVSTRSA